MRRLASRRSILEAAGVLALGGALLKRQSDSTPAASGPAEPVAVLRAESYSDDLLDCLIRGARLCGLEARGKRVLLKPNLVEYSPGGAINTEARLVAAAVELFRYLGAREILIGEGPGHRRDTLSLTEDAGYRRTVPGFDGSFVELNYDDVAPVEGFPGLKQIYLPKTALSADLIVSMPKMKTHHWAGATLSMKNYFGLVPGAVYGWPKNLLHILGIERSIVGLYRIFPRSFAIVDGIVGMEGNGPIQGQAKATGVIAMGRNLAAVDAACCQIMGIDPHRIGYLRDAGIPRIEQRGEAIAAVRRDYALLNRFRYLRSSRDVAQTSSTPCSCAQGSALV